MLRKQVDDGEPTTLQLLNAVLEAQAQKGPSDEDWDEMSPEEQAAYSNSRGGNVRVVPNDLEEK